MQEQEKKGVFTDARGAELQKEIKQLVEVKLSQIVGELISKIQEYFKRRDEWVGQVDRLVAEKDKEIMGYKNLNRKLTRELEEEKKKITKRNWG